MGLFATAKTPDGIVKPTEVTAVGDWNGTTQSLPSKTLNRGEPDKEVSTHVSPLQFPSKP